MLAGQIPVTRALVFQETNVCHVRRIDKTGSKTIPPLNLGDIKIGSDVYGRTKEKLYKLLQNYRDCFALSLDEIGCAPNEFEMKIELNDSKPIVYRPYRLSFSEKAKVREMVNELIENDIIRESTSDYASPILMVKKKTGEQRLCVDFRS